MEEVEFYTFDNELWYKSSDGTSDIVDEKKPEIIRKLLESIRNMYPKAYEALKEIYRNSASNIPYYQYLMVRRFCKCNFGKLDTTQVDIKSDGSFNFEKVDCPLRGECKFEGVICSPRFNSKLSPAEERVMRLFYKGKSKDEIANQLYISVETVKNHIKASYVKLGVHEKSEFVRYANQHNLFNN